MINLSGGFMKLTILMTLFLTFIVSSVPAFAGGIHCKYCPAESAHCMPRPNCQRASENLFDKIAKIYESETNGLCPSSSVSACKGKAVGSTCGDNIDKRGTCSLTPLTAGGFCRCD